VRGDLGGGDMMMKFAFSKKMFLKEEFIRFRLIDTSNFEVGDKVRISGIRKRRKKGVIKKIQ